MCIEEKCNKKKKKMVEILAKLMNSPLYGGPCDPVARNGVCLKGITKKLNSLYGKGHIKKRVGCSNRKLGNLVHRELFEWIGWREKQDRCKFKKEIHPWSAMAIKIMNENNLIPMKAEVPIAYGGIGTRIDIVAKKTFCSGAFLISVKTGIRRDSELKKRKNNKSSMFPTFFPCIERSERNLDNLQVTIERCLARIGHNVQFESAYILEVPEGILRLAPKWTEKKEIQDFLMKKII